MADVVTLEASLKLLDQVSPSLEDMEKALQGFESALGITREELEENAKAQAQLEKEIRMVELAANALGLSLEQLNEILEAKVVASMDAAFEAAQKFNDEFNRAADMAADVDKAFDAMHDDALRMNEAIDQQRAKLNETKDVWSALGGVLSAISSGSFKDLLGAFMELPAWVGVAFQAINMFVGGIKDAWSAMTQLGEKAEQIQNKAVTFDTTSQSIQQMQRAAESSGQSFEMLARSMQRLDKSAVGNSKAFQKLGLDAEQFTRLDMASKAETLAKKLGEMENATQRNVLMQQLLGRQGQMLLPTFKAIAEGAGSLTVALGTEQAEAAAKFDDALDLLHGGMGDLKDQFVSLLTSSPEVTAAIELMGQTFAGLAAVVRGAAPMIKEWMSGFFNTALMLANIQFPGLIAAVEKAKEMAAALGAVAKMQAEEDKKQAKREADEKAAAEAARIAAEEAGKSVRQLVEEKSKDAKATAELTKASQIYGRTISDPKLAADIIKQSDAFKKSEAQIKANKNAVEALVKGFSSQKAQQEMANLAAAIDRVGLAKAKAADPNLAEKILKLEEAGAKATPELHALAQELRDSALAAKQFDEAMAMKNKVADLLGTTDLKKFYEMREVLEEVTGAMAGDLGGETSLSAVGMIPIDKIEDLAKFYQQAADEGQILTDVERSIIARAEEIRAATERAAEEERLFGQAGVDAARMIEIAQAQAQAKFAKWGQLFQGLIGLAGLFGETAAEAAQIASNSFDQFAKASEMSRSAGAMKGTAFSKDQIKAMGGLDKLSKADFDKTMATNEAKAAKFNATINASAAVVGMFGDKLQKSTNPSVQKLGGALSGAAAGAKMGAAFGPWGAAIGAVGGAIMGFIGKAKKMREEMKKLKKEFLESHGGMEKLAEEAKRAGVSIDKAMKAKTPEAMKKEMEAVNKQLEAFNGLIEMAGGSMEALKGKAADAGVSLEAIFNAKTPEEYVKAVEDVKKQLSDWDKANDKLNAAMDKYGISVDQLGPKFRQAGLDKIGLGLLESFSLLKAAGVDVSLITEKMGKDMSDYVNRVVAAGSTVPMAMKPMIEEMIKNGDLLDENGEAYESLEDAGIQFAQTLEEGIASAVKAIEELVAVLAKGFNIPVNVTEGSGGGGGAGAGAGGGRRGGGEAPDAEPSFAGGSDGFRDFGSGTSAILHGTEAVVTPGGLEGAIASAMAKILETGGVTGRGGDVSTVVNLAISENPMQTAETVEQMRSFTLETVEKEVARSLADAISEGRA